MLGSFHNKETIPDQIDPVIGYKGLNLIRNFDRWVLISPDMKTPWVPKAPMLALCPHDENGRPGCHCGINVFKTKEQLERSRYRGCNVLARVGLWGEVQEYEDGYRSEYAYPQHLEILNWNKNFSDADREQISQDYGVLVELKDSQYEDLKPSPTESALSVLSVSYTHLTLPTKRIV